MSEVNMELAKTIYDSVCTTLDKMSIKYTRHDNDLVVTVGHKGKDMSHNLIILVNAEKEALQIIEKLPFTVDPEKATDIASAVCLVNNGFVCGGFEYELGDSISFKMSQFYSGSLVGEATIERMIIGLVLSVEEYDDKFMALNKGYLKVEDFKE